MVAVLHHAHHLHHGHHAGRPAGLRARMDWTHTTVFATHATPPEHKAGFFVVRNLVTRNPEW